MLNVNKLLKMAGIATGTLVIALSAFGDWWCNRCQKTHRNNQNCPYARLENPYSFDCNNEYEGMSDDEDVALNCVRMQLIQMEENKRIAHQRRNESRLEKLRTLINELKDQSVLQQALNSLHDRAQNLGFQIRDGQVVRQGFNPCAAYDPYGCNEINHYGYHCNPYYGYACN